MFSTHALLRSTRIPRRPSDIAAPESLHNLLSALAGLDTSSDLWALPLGFRRRCLARRFRRIPQY